MTKRERQQTVLAQAIGDDDARERDLRDALEALVRSVAALDEAGLPVQHKSAIAQARKLRKRLQS